MAFAWTRSLALALPLVVGLACTHDRSSQARTGTTAQEQPTATASAPEASNPASPLPGHSDDQVIAGRLTRVTEDSISIASGLGEEKVLRVVPQTLVTIDGMDAGVADLQEGEEVRAFFNTEEGRDVAVRIVSPVGTDKG